jgi:DUF4097 and DUF4098 domain-containing protein YvlB
MHRNRALLIASLFVASVAQASVDSPIHKTLNVAGGGTLTLDTDIGDVRITPANTNTVTVDIKRRAKSDDVMNNFIVTVDQSGNDVTIRGKYEKPASKWFNWSDEIDATFTITVPASYNVHASTSGGDVKLGDIGGNVYARTSGGNLDIGKVKGEVDGRTSGGDVTLAGATGRADLRTSGGGISVGDVDGPVQARSSGGSIDVRRVNGDLFAHTSGGGITVEDAMGSVDADTSGGSIRARMSQQPRSDSRFSTSGGGITLSVAPNIAVDLDAHTSGGGVDSDVPITILGKQGEDSLSGKINGGGPRLVLRSSGGGIRVKRL